MTEANVMHGCSSIIEFPLNQVSFANLNFAPNPPKIKTKRLARFGSLYGSSPVMQKMYEMLERVGPTEVPVMLTGESGSGKEMAAHTIHKLSQRKNGPFTAINCGAIPANLIEAELFGHERGSFTGAQRAHKGYFERAAGGTLFLDEITEMAPELQVKLLRVLENNTFSRLGGDKEVKSNVRIIAATNRSLDSAVSKGMFREDLMYRLAVFPLELPPLRVRGEDITLLAQHFLSELNQEYNADKRFSPQALQILRSHTWPGNVRELKNVVQRSFILHDETLEVLGLDGGPALKSTSDTEGLRVRVGTPLAEAERRIIFATLTHCGGNKKKAAEMLGLSLKTLYNRLSLYESEPREVSAIA